MFVIIVKLEWMKCYEIILCCSMKQVYLFLFIVSWFRFSSIKIFINVSYSKYSFMFSSSIIIALISFIRSRCVNFQYKHNFVGKYFFFNRFVCLMHLSNDAVHRCFESWMQLSFVLIFDWNRGKRWKGRGKKIIRTVIYASFTWNYGCWET